MAPVLNMAATTKQKKKNNKICTVLIDNKKLTSYEMRISTLGLTL